MNSSLVAGVVASSGHTNAVRSPRRALLPRTLSALPLDVRSEAGVVRLRTPSLRMKRAGVGAVAYVAPTRRTGETVGAWGECRSGDWSPFPSVSYG